MSNGREIIKAEDVHGLVEHFMRNSYKAKDSDSKSEQILNSCIKLFGKDYKYTTVDNTNGELCSHYPSKIVILEYTVNDQEQRQESIQSLYDVGVLKELFNKARFARCRARFVVPVILYEGKHICRSATISGGAEIYGRSGFDFFMTGGESIPDGQSNDSHSSQKANVDISSGSSSNEWQLFNRIRGQDIKLLKTFSVGYICDLMVEKKKVKFGMNVTSSEKVDKEHRYADFHILSVPYPGCEFFKEWKDSGYRADSMTFDWNQGYVDANLDLPRHPSPPRSIDWLKYRNWDLITLTQNYLKLLLHYVRDGDSGLLIHCISGWDRTPLFISLLRLTLWADGAIHNSLNPTEMLYLTIAYDWYLYGHNLPDRATKGEEIFFFCFFFLKYLTSEEFSVTKRRTKRDVTRNNSECMIDGVLLDPDLNRASYRGSNTSINSTSSLNSTKSSVDNAPIYFSASSLDEDTFVPNGPAIMVANNNPQQRLSDHTFRGSVSSHSTSTSSPMAVPSAVCRNLSDLRNSPNCGSWQIISGSGSLRGSTSSHGSVSSYSENCQGHCTQCVDGHDMEESQRKQRLDAVRRNFMTIYTSLVGSQPQLEGGNSSTGAGSAISGLLGNFAEKVGFRAGRNSYV